MPWQSRQPIEKQIIHRYLKPGNILILNHDTASELVKVIDFSIAKSLNEEGSIQISRQMTW